MEQNLFKEMIVMFKKSMKINVPKLNSTQKNIGIHEVEMKKIKDILLFEDSSIISFLLNFVFSMALAVSMSFGSLMNPCSVYSASKSNEIMADKVLLSGLEWIRIDKGGELYESEEKIDRFIGNVNALEGLYDIYAFYDWEKSGMDVNFLYGSNEFDKEYERPYRPIMISEKVFERIKKTGVLGEDGTHQDVDESNIVGLVIKGNAIKRMRITGVYIEAGSIIPDSFYMTTSGSVMMPRSSFDPGAYQNVCSYIKHPSKEHLIEYVQKYDVDFSLEKTPESFTSFSSYVADCRKSSIECNTATVVSFYILGSLAFLYFLIRGICVVSDYYHSYKRQESDIRHFFISNIKNSLKWFGFASIVYLVLYLCLYFTRVHFLISIMPSLILSILVMSAIYFGLTILIHAFGCFIEEGMEKNSK